MQAKFGSIIVAGSGKIGGHVVSRNKSGAYIRTRVVPTNPQTVYQQASRALLSAASSAWSALTPAQRSSWNNAKQLQVSINKLGDQVLLSGKSLFVQVFCNLSLIGVSPLTSPAVSVSGFSFSSLSVAAVVSDSSLTLTFASAIPVTHKILCFATPPMPAGISFVKNAYRKYDLAINTNVSPFNNGSGYEARLGDIAPAGNRIHVLLIAVEIASGKSNIAGSANCVISA